MRMKLEMQTQRKRKRKRTKSSKKSCAFLMPIETREFAISMSFSILHRPSYRALPSISTPPPCFLFSFPFAFIENHRLITLNWPLFTFAMPLHATLLPIIHRCTKVDLSTIKREMQERPRSSRKTIKLLVGPFAIKHVFCRGVHIKFAL